MKSVIDAVRRRRSIERIRRSPIAQALSRVSSGNRPEVVVQSLATELLDKCPSSDPPYNLNQCACNLGLRIEYDPSMKAEGAFESPPNGPPRILLPSKHFYPDPKRRRQRFTIAHEIGHFMIRQYLDQQISDEALTLYDEYEEFLCDRFAAELLMPHAFMFSRFHKLGLSPESLLIFADECDVSLTALLCRVTTLMKGPVISVIWKHCDGRLTVEWASLKSFRDPVLCATGKTSVERALGSSRAQEGNDELLFSGKRQRWPAVSQRLPSQEKVLSVYYRRDFAQTYFIVPAR